VSLELRFFRNFFYKYKNFKYEVSLMTFYFNLKGERQKLFNWKISKNHEKNCLKFLKKILTGVLIKIWFIWRKFFAMKNKLYRNYVENKISKIFLHVASDGTTKNMCYAYSDNKLISKILSQLYLNCIRCVFGNIVQIHF
jgi:hypothetical protein